MQGPSRDGAKRFAPPERRVCLKGVWERGSGLLLYRTNPKDLKKYLLPGTRCCCSQKKNAKKINYWLHALCKNGFRKKNRKMKYLLPTFAHFGCCCKIFADS